jgi:hypothetical protein
VHYPESTIFFGNLLSMTSAPTLSFATTADEVATAFSTEIKGKNGASYTHPGQPRSNSTQS